MVKRSDWEKKKTNLFLALPVIIFKICNTSKNIRILLSQIHSHFYGILYIKKKNQVLVLFSHTFVQKSPFPSKTTTNKVHNWENTVRYTCSTLTYCSSPKAQDSKGANYTSTSNGISLTEYITPYKYHNTPSLTTEQQWNVQLCNKQQQHTCKRCILSTF